MDSSSRKQKTALITGANGYIGHAVALAFQRAGYMTFGLVRSSRSATELQMDSIIPIVGSAADHEGVLSAVREHTSRLDVIASTTEDRKDYVPHFNDTLILLRALAYMSNEKGVRPLVLFTSGCKDYGQGELDGSLHLQPHTEQFPLRPPAFLRNRATHAIKVLQETSFDSAVLRPTLVHGGASSHLGSFFAMAAEAKSNSSAIKIQGNPRTIVHSMNVDVLGDAYVALSEHETRAEVAGECFNVSCGNRYETLQQIAEALAKLYSIEEGVEYEIPETSFVDGANALTNFSQYVGSEKISKLTGWRDESPMFAQDLSRYRQEYEDAQSANAD